MYQDPSSGYRKTKKNIKNKQPNEILFLKQICIKLGLISKTSDLKWGLIRRQTNNLDPELAALDDSLSFLDFCVIAALSESIYEISSLIGQRHGIQGRVFENDPRFNTSALVNKINKLHNHYEQMFKINSIDSVCTELISCGIKAPMSEIIYRKVVRETGYLRFYDFVLYSPLFNILHDHAIENPLGAAIPLLPKIPIS